MKKKLLTFLLTALLAFGVGWAETYTYTFKKSVFSSNGTQALGDVDWTLSGDGGYWGYDGTKGQQFGSGSKPYKSLTLSTSNIPGTISSITVNASTASSATATLSVTVGGNSYISRSLTATATDYTGSGTSSGEIKIMISQTTSKALYIKSITVVYEQGTTQETVATPAFSPEAGNYTSAQNVTISCATSGATIYYTTDGTTPTTSSAVYSAAIPVSETTTIKAIAVKSGMTDSEVAEATYTISATPEPGKNYVKVESTQDVTDGQYLIVYETTSVALDGSLSSIDANNDIISVTISSKKIPSNATTDASSFTIKASNGSIQQKNGKYIGHTGSSNTLNTSDSALPNTITIDDSGNAVIAAGAYTLRYNDASGTNRFRYYKSGQKAIQLYKLEQGTPVIDVEEPEITPATGTYYESQTVSIDVPEGTTVYYTTDGTEPTAEDGTEYTGEFTATYTAGGTTTVKVIAIDGNGNASDVVTATYTWGTFSVTISPATQTFSGASTVSGTITATPSDATVEYSFDNTTWVTYTDGFTTPDVDIDESVTVYARATMDGVTVTDQATYTREALPAPAVPAFSIEGGEVETGTTVTITAPEGCTLYVNGTEVEDNPYELTIDEAQTVTAYAVNSEGTPSETVSYSFTVAAPSVKCEAVIEFKNNESDAGTDITDNSIKDYYVSGAGYISSITDISKVYKGLTGLKFSSSSVNGNITFNLAEQADGWRATKITLNAKKYGGDAAALKLTAYSELGTQTPDSQSLTESLADYEFVLDGRDITGFKIAALKRAYLKSITIEYICTPVIDVEEPEITPATGTYYESQTVSIDVPEGTTVYFTTDGTDPTSESATYSEPFTVNYSAGNATTVKAIAIDGNGNASDVVSVEYTWGTLSVTISPATKTFSGASTVSGTITATPSDATVEYSFDSTNWQSYDSGFTTPEVTVGGSVTVYARATKGGATVTDTATYTREALPAPAAPTFSVEGGAVEAGTVVTITAPEGCTLFVNGTAVTSPYEITINEAQTVTAYAVNGEGTQGETVSYEFTIAAPSVKCEAFIEFDDNGSDASSAVTENSIGDYITAGADYVESISDIARVYQGATGLKFSSGSSNGNITFNLAKQADGWRATKITLNAKKYGSDDAALKLTAYSEQGTQTPDSQSLTESLADYEFVLDGRDITGFKIAALKRAYLKSITIEYICTPDVEEPEITPATGTYYESQTVSIDVPEGTTVYYTTDGSEPTAEDGTEYTGEFTATYTAGGTTTVKAIAIDSIGNASEVVTATYTWAKPVVSINPGSRTVTAASEFGVTLSATPEGCTIYYTTDGTEPTTSSAQYDGTAIPVALNEVGDQVVIKAIAVNNGVTGDVATATYKYQNVEVNVPYFSPLQGNTYYGDQTLEMACSTPNADIFYEIVQVSGATAPDASSVSEPANSSTYYDGPVAMTAGHSYYVKAIAYVGGSQSVVKEGWYTIKSESEFEGVSGVTYVKSCKEFNDLTTTGVKVRFMNPVQVVYHSTYTNNGEFAEFCYVRDNSDYACVYFGKRDTGNKTIYQMGDWIDGSQIEGEVNIWDSNFHNQLGTSSHSITSWPSQALGWSEVIPNTVTCAEIAGGTTDGANLWGNYVHVRYTTMSDVHDYSTSDPKHTGYINDPSGVDTYYDKFYRWSAGTCSYQNHNEAINCLGDYDQEFFTAKQNAGATFDVYGVVDYYKPYDLPFEICPIDFLWIYKPVVPAGGEFTSTQTINLTATQPEWAAEGVVIYYKTDDMEDWAVYNGPFDISSTTTLQAYAEVPAKKNDTAETDYNDYVRSVTVSATYTFTNIADPVISPESCVIEVSDGTSVSVSVATNSTSAAGTVTIYTTNGEDPRTSDEVYTVTDGIDNLTIDETTTVTAISYIVVGEETIWSNPVSETYTFVKKNGVEYTLCKTAPVVGNVYVIVNKAHQMGLSTQQNANNRGSVGVMFKDNTGKDVVYGNDELAQFTLEAAVGGRYYFKTLNGDQAGYLCVETNDRANLVTEAAHDDNGADVASVSIGASNNNVDKSYIATISYSYNGVTRYLRYFNNGHIFSTYTDGALNEDVFLYGIEATPLAYVEASGEMGKQYTISDQLIGAWAVNDGTHRYLWAKDQGNLSIDKTFARADQTDYMCALADQDIAMGQTREWDQSNWVILDFGGLSTDISPEDYVGMRIQSTTVKGEYVDDMNFRIALGEAPTAVVGETATGYPGYTSDPFESNTGTDYWYNQYTTVNFVADNLNVGTNEGAVAGAASPQSGRPMFFMNPKIQEIAHVWAVYAGTDNGYDKFDVYECADGQNFYDLSGSFWVSVNDGWLYNKLNTTDNSYGRPDVSGDFALAIGGNYAFHVAVNRTSANYGPRRAAVKDSDNDADFKVYPLDIPAVHLDPTGVTDLTGVKTVSSVRYYNIMGMESEQPIEGVNIVVTRYTDGTSSTVKVMR